MSTEAVTSPYGPAPTGTGTRRAPVVVPLDPARGWASADRPRRAAAVAAVPVAAAYLTLGAISSALSQAALLLLLLAGPPTFYSLARVLRPYPPGGERTVRHWAAAISTAYSLPGFALMLDDTLDLDLSGGGIALALVAALGAVVTLVWGAIALVVRLVGRAQA